MKNLIKILSIITFISATATVASIFYEGVILKWVSFVGLLIIVTDICFVIATTIGIFYYKNNKSLFYSHLISVFVILIGVIIILVFGEDMPKWLFVFWEFYILYFYGVIVVKKMWNFKTK